MLFKKMHYISSKYLGSHMTLPTLKFNLQVADFI